MNYYEIGQRVRKFRKAYNLSQEQLAEKIGISVTHMSHIETGNTKLSLPVFVDIARALSIRTDDLLYDMPQMNKTVISQEISEILNSCSMRDMYILSDVIKAVKISLDKYCEPPQINLEGDRKENKK
ncbi:MAG: helix-turn-helix transcriptional regulator [Roseburia sp.]|nr:helix-turn-helix transcriptional regulator [Roseburia sp.]